MGPREIYRRTRKRPDLAWNTYVARPPAAVVVALVAPTRVTPNQLTLAALGVAAIAAALIIGAPGYAGLLAAIVVYQLSYVLDCADGMLARLRGIASPSGHLLDFLMDELKAFLILGAVGARLYREPGARWAFPPGSPWWLLLTVAGLVCLASGIALTTFLRRPEIAGPPVAAPAAAVTAPRSPVRLALGALERIAKLCIHYPSYILLVALVGRLELYFFPYLVVNALYALRALAQVALRFGRSDWAPLDGA